MKHGDDKFLSRMMALAAAGLLALGLAGCNPDNPSKDPGGPGGMSKDAPSSSPMAPEKK
jgi:hypothetical protein